MNITTGIYSIAKIEAQACQAAHKFVDVNDACPYPFHSAAGGLFRDAFYAERNRMLLVNTAPQAHSIPGPSCQK